MPSIEKRITNRISKAQKGDVLTTSSFSDIGASGAIRIALFRLVHKGIITRLAPGLFYIPVSHPRLGILSPDPKKVANAIQQRDSARIIPSGSYAAHMLGLTEQVPARISFLTDGPSRNYHIGKQTIIFKRTSLRNLAVKGSTAGLVIQALRSMGKQNIHKAEITLLKKNLNKKGKKEILDSLFYAPAWMRPILRSLSENK